MKSWLRIFYLMPILVLSACSHFQDSSISYDQKSLNEKAIVVIDGAAPFKYLFVLDGEVPVCSYWERIDPAAVGDKKIEYQFREFYREHMILPGIYKMTGLGYKIGNYSYYMNLSAADVTFTAAPGEFIYLGDIIIKDAEKRTNTPLLEDAYEKSVVHVKRSLPDITKPLEKKLIKGLEPGKLIELRASE